MNGTGLAIHAAVWSAAGRLGPGGSDMRQSYDRCAWARWRERPTERRAGCGDALRAARDDIAILVLKVSDAP
jgi:hypothetical protein